MDDMFQDFYAQETTTGYPASNILASFWLSKRKAYEELATNKEQDAHEFFQILTEELHEINGGGRPSETDEIPNPKRVKKGSDPGCKCIVHQTFYGKLHSTITCQNPDCGGVNTSIESFLDLSLGLEAFSKKKILKAEPLSLRKCLDEEYKNWEHCDYNCLKCESRDAKKQLSIKKLPNVLCIQLKVSQHLFAISVSSILQNAILLLASVPWLFMTCNAGKIGKQYGQKDFQMLKTLRLILHLALQTKKWSSLQDRH
jgi:ubiquitin carboxyl-terminal hydrolase 22/27/51